MRVNGAKYAPSSNFPKVKTPQVKTSDNSGQHHKSKDFVSTDTTTLLMGWKQEKQETSHDRLSKISSKLK